MSQGMGLHQHLNLSQTLSPQMQQSLHYLQTPAMELRAAIQQELSANPVLEEVIETTTPDEDNLPDEIERIESQIEEWKDYFAQMPAHESSGQRLDPQKRDYFFDSQTSRPTLRDHLLEQLNHSTDIPELREAGQYIIGNLDEDGFLREDIQELADDSPRRAPWLHKALTLIQTFHPSGSGARDLKECLLIQLRHLNLENSLAAEIVSSHMDLLARKKYTDLARAIKTTPERTMDAVKVVRSLRPRPGIAFQNENAGDIIQEEAAFLCDDQGIWQVVMNADPIPKLRISDQYKDLLAASHADPSLKDYLKERIRSGKFLIKCMHQRVDTLENILKEVAQRQSEFLEFGPSKLKPLTMNQVAQAVGVHETTVSRAAANKYVRTPWGVLPIKYFFTSGYRTDGGERMSNTSVKESIHDLIQRENRTQPLSDADIVDILKEQGIPLARRTVAKYRMELNILPSNLRRES
ncbi:MAG: RNA polymerase factor sigma-54 [Candidatus Methylacidiphilales bacterium]